MITSELSTSLISMNKHLVAQKQIGQKNRIQEYNSVNAPPPNHVFQVILLVQLETGGKLPYSMDNGEMNILPGVKPHY